MSVKVAQHSSALTAPGPVAPVALSQRVEQRYPQGNNEGIADQAPRPVSVRPLMERDDASHADWADRRAPRLPLPTAAEPAIVVALVDITVNVAPLPSAAHTVAQPDGQAHLVPPTPAPAASGAPAASEPAQRGGDGKLRSSTSHAGSAAAIGRGSDAAAAPAMLASPLAGQGLPAAPALAPTPAIDVAQPALPPAPSRLGGGATSPVVPNTSASPPPAVNAASVTGQSDAMLLRGQGVPGAVVATPMQEPTQVVQGDAAAPQLPGGLPLPAASAIDTAAAPSPGGESMANAARAEANLTTRRIVRAAQQAEVLQVAMATRSHASSQLNVAFHSWGVGHSVTAHLDAGRLVLQPSTQRVGQALASAELPSGADLLVAVEHTDTATDERRRRRGEQHAS
jgi:hypothetical protein